MLTSAIIITDSLVFKPNVARDVCPPNKWAFLYKDTTMKTDSLFCNMRNTALEGNELHPTWFEKYGDDSLFVLGIFTGLALIAIGVAGG